MTLTKPNVKIISWTKAMIVATLIDHDVKGFCTRRNDHATYSTMAMTARETAIMARRAKLAPTDGPTVCACFSVTWVMFESGFCVKLARNVARIESISPLSMGVVLMSAELRAVLAMVSDGRFRSFNDA